MKWTQHNVGAVEHVIVETAIPVYVKSVVGSPVETARTRRSFDAHATRWSRDVVDESVEEVRS
jgi:Ni,Fe-hydrogenase I large subunit